MVQWQAFCDPVHSCNRLRRWPEIAGRLPCISPSFSCWTGLQGVFAKQIGEIAEHAVLAVASGKRPVERPPHAPKQNVKS
jgi:hypothetical protein